MLATGASDVFAPSVVFCLQLVFALGSGVHLRLRVGYSTPHWLSSGTAGRNNPMWFYCLEE